MNGAVEVWELCKDFRTFDRKEGLRGALVNLFHRDYRTVRAVDRISFQIQPGEMVGYIGPNGAGKSTSIKMLTGILVPTSGLVRCNGFQPWRQRQQYTHSIGAVFGQRTQLWWDIAPVESFRLLQRIYGVSPSDYEQRMRQFDQLLELGRFMHSPVRKLSLGERMRCDIAASLLHNPPLLFLDEPTIGLDIVAKERIRGFLKDTNRRYGTTVLLTTHDLSDIEELCQRLMIIDRGKLLFDGPLARLKEQFWRQTTIRLDVRDRDQAARLESLQIPGVTLQHHDALKYSLHFDRDQHPTAAVIRHLVNSVELLDLAIEEQSIEEVVKKIYQDGHVEALPG
jgi:ABC-2 type transport system ATP-binding protein